MKATGYILLAVLLGLGAVSSAAENMGETPMPPKNGKSPAILLQEAIYQEETAGDLDKAIELYGQVLEQAADMERLAARATYQLGLCHLKKGDESAAVEYFRKAINDYPKQTSVVKKAQAELDKIAPEESNGLYNQATPLVWQTLGSLYGQVCAKGGMKNLYTNSNIHFVNSDFVSWYGGYGFYTNTTPEPISGRVQLGRTTMPHQKYYDIMGNPLNTQIVQDDRPGQERYYKISLDLPQSVAPGQFYPYAWANEGTNQLGLVPSTNDQYTLTMDNHFGSHAFEVFFLVVPNNLQIAESAEPCTDKQTVGDYTIYAYEKEVQPEDNHVVTVYLSKKDTAGGQTIFKDSFEEGGETPTGWEKGQSVDGVSYVWDKNAGSNGKASLCLRKDVKKYFPIAQWTRKFDYTGNAKELTVSAQVRAEKAYKAIIDALFLDDKGEWIKHQWVSYIGAKEQNDPPANHNWKNYSGTVEIPENTKTIVIGLQMYGPGTVWFDEVQVAYTNGQDKSEKIDPLKAEKTQKALDAAQVWLDLMDKGQYDQSWDNTAAFFKKTVTKSQWASSAQAVRTPVGALISRDVLSQTYTRTLPGAPDGEYVVITFKASYENKKEAIETVTPMLDSDGQWRVSGYFIK